MGQVITFVDFTPPERDDAVSWTQAAIEEALTAAGSYTLIDTVAITPDADPSDPAAQSFTTDQGTAARLWYRVYFLDDDGNTSTATAAVQNIPESAPFATADDLETRLGLTLTDDEIIRAESLLLDASGLIQDETRQTIGLEQSELTMPGTTDDRIRLPERPVVSVSSVELDGVPLVEGGDWYLDGNEIVRRAVLLSAAVGMLNEPFLLGGGFGYSNQTLTITYTHGYETIPATVKTICVAAVARCFVNPESVAREQVGDTMTVYDSNRFSPTGLMLTDDEKRSLRRIFGARGRSITIRG